MASGITIGGHGTSLKGLDALKKRIANIAPAIRAQVAAAIDASADDFVEEMKAIAPVSELEPHPGELKASIHKEDGRHELSRLVVADAKDEHGHGYAPHVEFGHIDKKSRKHVRPKPFFYPTVRRRKKSARARVSRAMSKAVKSVFP